jgi:hypothetical protein
MPRLKNLRPRLEASDADAPPDAQVAEILADFGSDMGGWLLITQQLIFPCEANRHGSRESVIADLMGAITCHCHIVAVFNEGRRLTEAEVETLRAEAFEKLGPVSQARAEGKS